MNNVCDVVSLEIYCLLVGLLLVSGRGSLSVLNMKLVVYVCQRQYAGDINMMSAFTQVWHFSTFYLFFLSEYSIISVISLTFYVCQDFVHVTARLVPYIVILL